MNKVFLFKKVIFDTDFFLLAGMTSSWLFQEENTNGGLGFHCITEDDLVLEELDRVHKSLLWFFWPLTSIHILELCLLAFSVAEKMSDAGPIFVSF